MSGQPGPVPPHLIRPASPLFHFINLKSVSILKESDRETDRAGDGGGRCVQGAGGREELANEPEGDGGHGIFLAAATPGYYVFYKDERNAREGHAIVGNGVTAHDPPSDVQTGSEYDSREGC
ncbi:hypothetical protein NL676_034281 [Syzygium grande]|nr:hypothetical protein NL676_034281 [Syzygium grande]